MEWRETFRRKWETSITTDHEDAPKTSLAARSAKKPKPISPATAALRESKKLTGAAVSALSGSKELLKKIDTVAEWAWGKTDDTRGAIVILRKELLAEIKKHPLAVMLKDNVASPEVLDPPPPQPPPPPPPPP
eukprot:9090986-Pyramimonas_sp.AAC.1